MPLVAAVVPALAAIGGGSAVAGAAGLAATAASAYGAIKQGNAASKAADAAGRSGVDIDALNNQAKAIAEQNARDSAALEQQMTPEVPALRRAANLGILNGLQPDQDYNTERSALINGLGNGIDSPVLRAAIAKAGSDLSLGGRLGTDQQNLVTRNALSNAGAVGGGLGLGRDLVTRDLGISSLGLENSRLQTALGAGGQEAGLAQAGQTNLLNRVQLLQQMSNSLYGRNLAAGQYGESIRQPNVGLDPSSVANIAIGNSNASRAASANQAGIYGQQGNNYLNFAGQLAGGLFANRNPTAFNSSYGSPTQTSSYFGNYNPGGK